MENGNSMKTGNTAVGLFRWIGRSPRLINDTVCINLQCVDREMTLDTLVATHFLPAMKHLIHHKMDLWLYCVTAV